MARIVCQVLQRPERVTFIWSDGKASFPPYHISGSQAGDLLRLSAQAREQLARLPGNDAGLHAVGRELFQAIFPADQPLAVEVRDWFLEQERSGAVDSLEIASDAPGLAPWNVVSSAGQVWGNAFPLTVGGRVNVWRQIGLLDQPSVLLVLDPQVHEALPETEKNRLAALAAERSLEIARSRVQLTAALGSRFPEVLYFLGRVSSQGLHLGTDVIAPDDLRLLLEEQSSDPAGTLFFINACRGDETPAAASLIPLLRLLGDGLIATEQPAPAAAACQLGVAFLTRFIWEGVPLAAALQQARQTAGPVGLLYSALCPGNVCVVLDEEEEGEPDPGAPPPLPLPEKPFRPLTPFESEDLPLFTGRERNVAAFARLLDRSATRLAVVHGGSGVGKSSFLRAGVLPYLEDWSIGFRALRDRTDVADEGGAAAAVLTIPASQDLAGQLAEALCAYCDTPLTFATPTGATVTIDLPDLLRGSATAAPGLAQAIQAIPPDAVTADPPPVTMPQPLPESSGRTTPAELWSAMQNDTGLLSRLLAGITDRLPHELVILIEHGEELFTQSARPMEWHRRRLALQMLGRFAQGAQGAQAGSQCKIVLSLRTEFLGQLQQEFPEPDSLATYLLDDMSDDEIVNAIQLPASADPVPFSGEIPYEKYRFAFEEGAARAIVQEARLAPERRASLLPSVQAICAQLFGAVHERGDRVIRVRHLRTLKERSKGDFTLSRYVQGLLDDTFPNRAERETFKELSGQLVERHVDGTLHRRPVPADELAVPRDRHLGWLATLYAIDWIAGLILIALGWLEFIPRGFAWLGFGLVAIGYLCWLSWPARRRVTTPQWNRTGPGDEAAALRLRRLVDRAAEAPTPLLEVNYLLVSGKESAQVALAQDSLVPVVGGWMEDSKRQQAIRSRTSDLLWLFTPLIILVGAVTFFLARQGGANEAELAKEFRRILNQQKTLHEEPIYLGRASLANQAIRAGNALRARQFLLGIPAERRSFDWYYLWKRCQPETHQLLGHLMRVESVALAPDGGLAASAGLEGSVRAWNTTTGEILALYRGHNVPVFSVAVAADGKTIASGGFDGKIHLWEVTNRKDYIELGKPAKVLAGHKGRVLALAFAPKDKLLASAGQDGAAIVWDLAKNDKKIFKDHGGEVQAVAFTPDGKTLASAGSAGRITVWDIAGVKKRQEMKDATGEMYALAFAPDGKSLASGGIERHEGIAVGAIRIWSPDTGKPVAGSDAPLPRIRHGQGVFALAYTADGRSLLSGGKDNLIRIWDVAAGEQTAAIAGHLGWIRCLALQRHTVVTGSYDRTARLWDTRNYRNPAVLEGHKDWVCSVAFSEDDRLLASGSRDGTVRIWDPASGEMIETLDLAAPVQTLAFTPGKEITRLAAGTWADRGKSEIRIWTVGREQGKWKVQEQYRFKGLQGIAAVAFPPDATILAAAGEDGIIRTWDMAHGKPGAVLKGHAAAIRCLAFAPENEVLASGDQTGRVILWEWRSAKPLLPLAAHNAAATALAFSSRRDTGLLATAGNDQGIDLWKLAEREHPHQGTLRGHSGGLLALALSPPGDVLASAGWDQTIKLWALRAGAEERFTFTGHTGPVRALAFAGHGRTLASASHDRTIRLWRAAPRPRPKRQ